MKYDITAKPTRYNDRLFRSRLEARYAAFFDLLKINWEYEPFDLKGWSPDFILRLYKNEILVEVKPKVLIDIPLYVKMYTATTNTEYKLLILNDSLIDAWNCGFDGLMPLIQSDGFTFSSNGKTYPEFSASHLCTDKNGNIGIYEWDSSEAHSKDWEIIDRQTLQKLWSEAANKVMFLKP